MRWRRGCRRDAWRVVVMREGFGVPQGRPRKYSDAELVAAIREVRAASEYDCLSKRIYEDERLDRHPAVGTIEKWLGSWSRAKRLAEGDDE